MHTDDNIHRLLIDAMIAERRGQSEIAAGFIGAAAALHVQGFNGRPSFFGTSTCTAAPPADRMPPKPPIG